MKTTKRAILCGGAIAAALVFATPSLLVGYTLLGGNLGLTLSGNGYQRDVRVYSNFQDPAANNNNSPDANFPGALGAALAIWRGATAWNSNNPLAAKNFDFDWQGTVTTIGGLNDNIASSLGASCGGGGTLAYTEVPIADGWRMRFCEEWVWSDGPGNPLSGQIDMQAMATHELGHSLGMGHAQSQFCSGSCGVVSTMCPFYCNGSAERTLAVDDANGLQAIYGAMPAGKPLITSLAGSTNRGAILTINGSNFGATVNVKFTAGTSANTGTIPGTVYGATSSGGGTQVSVVIPNAAKDGNVLVWMPGNLLSNPFPINIDSTPPMINNVSPSSGPLRGGDPVSIVGTEFSGTATVTFDGVPAVVVARVGTTQIDVQAPQGSAEGQSATVTVSQTSGTANVVGGYTYDPNPVEVVISDSTPQVTETLTITVYGPANKPAAVVLAPPGSYTHPQSGLTFCFVLPPDFVRRPNQMNTGPLGQVSVTWTVLGNVGDQKNVQGVVIPSPGTFAQTNCASLTISP